MNMGRRSRFQIRRNVSLPVLWGPITFVSRLASPSYWQVTRCRIETRANPDQYEDIMPTADLSEYPPMDCSQTTSNDARSFQLMACSRLPGEPRWLVETRLDICTSVSSE